MKISLAQIKFRIGDFEYNIAKMIDAVEQAKVNHCNIICFPEMAVCGFPAMDYLLLDAFIDESIKTIEKLCQHAHDIAIVVGAPSRDKYNNNILYNSLYFLSNGAIKSVFHKLILSDQDINDESRYFTAGNVWGIIEYQHKMIMLAIGDNAFFTDQNSLLTEDAFHKITGNTNIDLVIHIAASPFTYLRASERLKTAKAIIDISKASYYYVNHCNSQGDIIMDGGSFIMNDKGIVIDEFPYFTEVQKHYSSDLVANATSQVTNKKDKIHLIHAALVHGIQDYFNNIGQKKAILGLSGGIDSAVTAVLAIEALGKENIRVLMMPSEFSTQHSIDDAVKLAENLGIHYDIISIEDIYNTYLNNLNPIFGDLPFNVTEENIQARIRAMLNMAVSNKFGHILLNTSNKSEAAMGYGTLYGDLCGGLSVLGDVYKTEVYELARYINKNREIIPEHSITKAPSAELRIGQKDSDSLPEYNILDPILYQYLELGKSAQEIIEAGNDELLVKRIFRSINLNEFKRQQTAPILRVSTKSFGHGRRIPVTGNFS